MLTVLVLLAAGAVHSPLDFEVSLGSSIEDDDADLDDLLTVEQRPGDVLVVPAAWGHATLNTQPSIGWASEVDHDRGYHDGDDAAFGDQWWRVSNVEGVPEPPSEENLGDDEILYGDI